MKAPLKKVKKAVKNSPMLMDEGMGMMKAMPDKIKSKGKGFKKYIK